MGIVYLYECTNGCPKYKDEIREVSDRNRPAICDNCGGEMHRRITAPVGIIIK